MRINTGETKRGNHFDSDDQADQSNPIGKSQGDSSDSSGDDVSSNDKAPEAESGSSGSGSSGSSSDIVSSVRSRSRESESAGSATNRSNLSSNNAERSRSKATESSSSPPTKPRKDLLFYVGVFLIVVAIAIAGFLVARHLATQSTYQNLEAVAGFDRDKLVDSSVEPSDYGLEIDWDALKAINSDIVGWLYVPGTNLSYPIVHGSDNDFYLNHSADKSSNSSGAIFLDYENSSDFYDLSTFIYGHNMLGNTMFSELTGYVDAQFLQDHPRIMIFTPSNVFDLTVIGAMRCKGTDPVRRTGFSGQTDFANYLAMLGNYQASGSYQSLVQATNIYCFSTCELFDLTSRVIVMATDTTRAASTNHTDAAISLATPASAILSTYQTVQLKSLTSSRRPTRKDS